MTFPIQLEAFPFREKKKETHGFLGSKEVERTVASESKRDAMFCGSTVAERNPNLRTPWMAQEVKRFKKMGDFRF